jgi:small subunit ribosomal protein S21
MAEVIIKEGESLEAGIKRVRTRRQKEGTVRIYKKKQYFTKPSDERRERKKKALKKLRRKQAKDAMRER